MFGFATLKAQLGPTMGEPTECEHPNSANGDTLQNTTTGLAFYRKSTNIPTFTDGHRHWGLTPAGLVYWEGSAIDPPGVAASAPSAAAPGPGGVEIEEMRPTRVYVAGEQRFFDDLVNMLVTGIAFGSTMQAYRGDELNFSDGQWTRLRGTPAVLGFNLSIDPNSLLEPLKQGYRPGRLEFKEEPFTDAQRVVWEAPPGPAQILAPVYHAAIVHYYESVAEEIEKTHGKDPKAWPDVLRFGWVVRNAFAHNGQVSIKDPALSAAWRGLTYSQEDNGREILYLDLMPAELIVLMEEMDAAIPRGWPTAGA